jgi:hypothetical protein
MVLVISKVENVWISQSLLEQCDLPLRIFPASAVKKISVLIYVISNSNTNGI